MPPVVTAQRRAFNIQPQRLLALAIVCILFKLLSALPLAGGVFTQLAGQQLQRFTGFFGVRIVSQGGRRLRAMRRESLFSVGDQYLCLLFVTVETLTKLLQARAFVIAQ